jgi:hypothetical protein
MKPLVFSSVLAGAVALALGLSGCGDSSDSTAKPEAAKPAGPPPRPGEDVMKAQMEQLQKKGMLSKVPGIPRSK